MKAQTEAMRALAYVVARGDWTIAHRHPDEDERAQHQAFVDLLIPIVKGWCTESGIEVASLGVQVHGGMGFIEETGAAQHLRDARITTIYEGTTGIQANDLVGRKIAREAGVTAKAVMRHDPRDRGRARAQSPTRTAPRSAARSRTAAAAADECIDWIVATYPQDVRAVVRRRGAVPQADGHHRAAAGRWRVPPLAAHRLLAEGQGDASFLKAKIATARFFADHFLAQVPGLARTITAGAPARHGADRGAVLRAEARR